ncbi:ROK family transcriptional regulator [Nocardioides marmorisolisilvae]|uniref:ROK family transcriptional regulator n=1 Tax=Nocardioides marmorisolisilvae TaxID=1542737 RepID=A0A3N0DRX0_9ACTN|nr:ROK family transcriptional regulator [Nocardioides marmorisolisilvae]RNL78370.1 ROK family transcriptional regulator [Nocardioides marmorisolisilvae]
MSSDAGDAARTAPGSAAALRIANQRRVLAVLLDRGTQPATQADITRETGLAAGTVSTIVRELAAAGVVSTVAGSGRRGTTVRLARGAGLVAGVDFGHNHVAVALGDMSGEVLGEDRRTLEPGHPYAEGLQAASDMLDTLLAAAGAERSELRNIGMGLPAPLSDGVVMSSAIEPGWVGVNARDEASRVFGVDVLIENDANLGALAEHRHGHGRGHANVVFVKVSSGVGAGLILDNQLFRGTAGTSGEIGHLTLNDQGPLCRCGSRGCLEAYAASGTALTMMHDQMPEAGVDEIIEAAKQGNVSALRVFEDAGLHLGWGLATVTNLLDPGVILVGGDMSHAGELLLESARLGLRRHVLAGTSTTPVLVAELGDRASMVGALVLAIDATDLLPA